MGCGASSRTSAVEPRRAGEQRGEAEDEAEAKAGVRGDSAVSKATADSGVGMEARQLPALPGAVPTKLPPLTSQTVAGMEAGGATRDGFQQQGSSVQERRLSNEILQELRNENIILVGQSSKSDHKVCEVEQGGQRRPARLEPLKVKKPPRVPDKEETDQKMEEDEEPRQSREDELRTRLRPFGQSRPVSTAEEDDGAIPTLVEELPLAPQPPFRPPLRHLSGGDGGETAERGGEEEEEEEGELTQVEEFRAGELESDSTFQQAGNKEEVF